MTTSKNIKNEELEKLFSNQLASGIPFCFYSHLATNDDGTLKKDKNGEEYYSLFIAQKKENPNAVQSLDAMMLGWESKRIYRSVKRMSKEVFEKGSPVIKGLGIVGKLHTKSLSNEQVFELMKSNKSDAVLKLKEDAFTDIQITHSFEKSYDGKEARKVYVEKEDAYYFITKNGNLTYEDTNLVIAENAKDTLFTEVELVKESEYQTTGADHI